MPPSMTPGSSIIVMVQSPMPTWPSPRSERLGTPKIPAIRFTRGTYFGASRFTYATACQVARPPLTDRTRSPRSQRAFTSRLPAVWSPSLPLDITTTWTGLLLLAGPAPAGMAASLAAPLASGQLASGQSRRCGYSVNLTCGGARPGALSSAMICCRYSMPSRVRAGTPSSLTP